MYDSQDKAFGVMELVSSRAAKAATGNPVSSQASSGVKPPSQFGDSDRVGHVNSQGRLFVHDVALTMGAEAAAVGSSLLLTGIVSRWMGARPLSEYLLLRRVLSWTVAATLLGLATGLPRYVALCAGSSKRNEAAYFLAALLCMAPTAIAAGGVLVLKRVWFARLLFGDPRETGLVIALALLIVGFAIHRAVHGYYRGLLEMTRANLAELTNLAALPLVVVATLAHSLTIAQMMAIVGALVALSAALFAVPVLKRLRGAPLNLPDRCGELLRYGVPRVPGEFGAVAITAIGPMLAVHFMPIAKVSPLLLGLNMLLVVGYAAGPIGIVLLSKISMMLGRNEHEAVQSRLRLLIAGVTEISVFACIQLAIFADVIIRAWVGPGFENQMGVIRVVLLAVPFYLFFMTLRSTIDAASVKPLNTANVMVSVAVYASLIAASIEFLPIQFLLMGIASSLLASQILLAMMTARTFRKFYGFGIPWKRLAPSFAAALALGAAALELRRWSGTIPIFEAAIAEAVLVVAYLAILARLGSGWLAYTWHVGVRGRADWMAAANRTGGVE